MGAERQGDGAANGLQGWGAVPRAATRWRTLAGFCLNPSIMRTRVIFEEL